MTDKIPSLYGLTERNIKTLYAVFSKYSDIKQVHLFGSRAKGNFKIGSDIDLAVMNKELQAITIAHVLADCAESDLPVAVDIVDFNTLTNPEFIDHIQRVGVLFYPPADLSVPNASCPRPPKSVRR